MSERVTKPTRASACCVRRCHGDHETFCGHGAFFIHHGDLDSDGTSTDVLCAPKRRDEHDFGGMISRRKFGNMGGVAAGKNMLMKESHSSRTNSQPSFSIS